MSEPNAVLKVVGLVSLTYVIKFHRKLGKVDYNHELQAHSGAAICKRGYLENEMTKRLVSMYETIK